MAFSVSYVYSVLDRYTGPLKRINEVTLRFRKTVDRVRGAMDRMSVGMKRFGEKASSLQGAVGALGLTAALRSIVTAGAEFERSMNVVAAITGAVGDKFQRMDELARELGRTTQFTAVQSAEGMKFLAQAGLNAERIIAAMPGVLQLAAAGGLDLSSAADIATNVLAGFGLEGKELARINDVLALTAASANTNVFELGQALSKAAPLASTTGQSVEGMVAILGKWADMGIKAEESGTALKMALSKLINPTAGARRALRRLRLSTKDLQDGDGGVRPLIEILGLLIERGASAKQFIEIFGERAGPRLAGFIKQGTDGMIALEATLLQANGSAAKMSETMMRGLPGAMLRTKSALEGAMISLTKSVIPILETFFNVLTGIFQTITELPVGVRQFLMVGLMLAAALTSVAVVAGILAMTLGSLFAVLAAITVPVWGIIAAVVAAVSVLAFWISTNNPLITQLKGLAGTVLELGGAVFDIFEPLLRMVGLVGDNTSAWSLFGKVLSMIAKSITLMIVPVKALLQALVATVRAATALARLDFRGAVSALGAGGMDILDTLRQGAEIMSPVAREEGAGAGQLAAQNRAAGQQQVTVRGAVELGLAEGLSGPDRVLLNPGNSFDAMMVSP